MNAAQNVPAIRNHRLNAVGLKTYDISGSDPDHQYTPEERMRGAIAQEVYAWCLTGFAPKAKVSKKLKDLIQTTYANSDKLTYVYELPYLVSIDFSDTIIKATSKKKMAMVNGMATYINKHQEVAWPEKFITDLSNAKENDGEDYFSRFMTIYLKEVIKIQDVPKFKSTIRSYRTDWKAAQDKT